MSDQIIRIPLKYLEVINTISDEEAWKIFKNILGGDKILDWLTKVYYNLIITDTNNIQRKVEIWQKNGILGKDYWKLWWRPKNNPLGGKKITPNIHNNTIHINKINKEEQKLSFWIKWLVKLKQTEHEKLIKQYGETVINKYIQDVENYIVNWKGGKYKDHYLAILKRLRTSEVKKIDHKELTDQELFEIIKNDKLVLGVSVSHYESKRWSERYKRIYQMRTDYKRERFLWVLNLNKN